ncbi:Mucin-12 [Toensbergia leucococca]|nr:Mucin-12 [Toensbergia leucococca]
MKSHGFITTLATAAGLAVAQIPAIPRSTSITCPASGGSFCASTSLTTNIIIRCIGTIGQPGNCNDNLAYVPPVGVKDFAPCYQSSPTAGDAACSYNNTIYPDVGMPFPIPPNKTTTTTTCTTSTPTSSTSSPFYAYPSLNSTTPLPLSGGTIGTSAITSISIFSALSSSSSSSSNNSTVGTSIAFASIPSSTTPMPITTTTATTTSKTLSTTATAKPASFTGAAATVAGGRWRMGVGVGAVGIVAAVFW